ncbi:MAG: hypothetical protein FWE84_05920 [Firmicutes bacterium]|nr:hypothetical protein [Bacillota bacterium]
MENKYTDVTYYAAMHTDGERFFVIMPDLQLAASGATAEEAVENMRIFFYDYLDCAWDMGLDLENPSCPKGWKTRSKKIPMTFAVPMGARCYN